MEMFQGALRQRQGSKEPIVSERLNACRSIGLLTKLSYSQNGHIFIEKQNVNI